MLKVFYDHLVVREEIIKELDKYEIETVEKEEIIKLADETLHHHTLDVILHHLPKEKHQKFLNNFQENPEDDGILEELKKEIDDIEQKITVEAEKVKMEILRDIKRSV